MLMVVGMDALKSFMVSLMMMLISKGFFSCSVFREKVSICLMSSRPRMPASKTLLEVLCSRLSLSARSSASSVKPMMAARMLLKSWAMPPASVPRASIFCDWRNWSLEALALDGVPDGAFKKVGTYLSFHEVI